MQLIRSFHPWLSSRWSHMISRTIHDIHDLLLPLETAIHQCLIPALTGRAPCSRQERYLFALPVRLGGLGLTNPATNSSHAFQVSERLTAPLAALIVAQSPEQAVDQTEITAIKKIRKTNRHRQEDQAKEIHKHLNPKLRRSIDLAKGERLLCMALSPPTGRPRLLPPQRQIQRCSMLEIWVESQ